MVGCPRCHGRNVGEISAGIPFLFHCASVNLSSFQCLEWRLLKELVPEPDGAAAPNFCTAFFEPSKRQAGHVIHKWTISGTLSQLWAAAIDRQLLVLDGNTGRGDATTSILGRQGSALCHMTAPCPQAVVAVGAYMDSSSAIMGEGYDRGRHGAVYLFHNQDADDRIAQAKNLTASGRNETHFVQQSQRVSAMDEDEDTMFGKHVSLSACSDQVGSQTSVCLSVTRTSCRNRVCRTPLSPSTAVAICHCEPSEHGYADEMYVFERHRNKPNSWDLGSTLGQGLGANPNGDVDTLYFGYS